MEIEIHQSLDPQFEDTKVYNIPRGYDLSKLDQSIVELIDARTLVFFKQSDDYFLEFSDKMGSEIIKSFINNLSKLEFRLIVVKNGKYNRGNDLYKGGTYISFSDSEKQNSNWVIDLESKMYNPSHYPEELLNLLKFGTIKFSYYLDGAQMWQLGNQNLAIKNESFAMFISHCDETDCPYEELRIIYEDYSGGYIFYDASHGIWYGGIDEGGVFRVKFSIGEIVDSIFMTHMKEEYPSINTIVNGEYLTNSNKT